MNLNKLISLILFATLFVTFSHAESVPASSGCLSMDSKTVLISNHSSAGQKEWNITVYLREYKNDGQGYVPYMKKLGKLAPGETQSFEVLTLLNNTDLFLEFEGCRWIGASFYADCEKSNFGKVMLHLDGANTCHGMQRMSGRCPSFSVQTRYFLSDVALSVDIYPNDSLCGDTGTNSSSRPRNPFSLLTF